MITRKELMDALEEVDRERITLEDYKQNEIIDVFEKRGLVEHEPTAKEKWEEHKAFLYTQGYVRKEEVILPYAATLRLADAAIKEAEEGARQ